MNLNKLFPRLSIRAKLGIAFALLALFPLAVVAAITTRITLDRLREAARVTLQQEVRRARWEVESALTRAEDDVVFMADAYLGRRLLGGGLPDPADRIAINEFLDHVPSLFRLTAISADGAVVFEAGEARSAPRMVSGEFYAWRAQGLKVGEHLLLPVEVSPPRRSPTASLAVPAVAVLVPVRDPSGEIVGLVVGEAYASRLFAGLERVPPSTLGATTGLVDADQRFLYHSEQKRTWASLLGVNADPIMAQVHAASAPAGEAFLRTTDHLVRAEPIQLGSSPARLLTLIRALPLREVDRPIREFLAWLAVTGAAILVLVTVLAWFAARELTTPIYRLSDAARKVQKGLPVQSLAIETNDELEDLAVDFLSMASDLTTQRRQLEELVTARTRELHQTHAELAGVLEHSADAIVGLDAEGRIRVWNRGAEALFGYSAADVLSRNVTDIWPEDERGAEPGYLLREVERRGAVVNYMTHRLTREGNRIPVSLTQTALRDEEGRRTGTSLVLRDTSLQSRLEEHMRRSERLAAMSVMAAGLAHEVNNPLAIIGNRLECMEAELGDLGHPTLGRDLGVLREHTTRLARLTGDLLRFARDPGEEPHGIDLAEVAGRVGGLLEHTLTSRNVRLSFHSGGATEVLGTGNALETVCLNLVLNSADAMPDGGDVTVDTRPLNGMVCMTVQDTGPGVPADLTERIFEPFFSTKGPRGTGLGLPLCRSIVERYGGRIWVEQPAHGGGRFIVALPAI